MAELASSGVDITVVADPRGEFAAVCQSVSPRLVGALTLRCGDRQLAEDLAQEALARAWRDWGRLRGSGRIEPWLFATAFNLLRSWHRKVLVARRRAPMFVMGDSHDRDVSVVVAVQRAVSSLPQRQREAVALRFYADLSVRDTAQIMRCADGTVRALTAQAVAALKKSFGSQIDFPDEETG